MTILTKNEKLDARWFNRFKELVFEDYEYFSGNKEHRTREMDRFLSGETINPTLEYPELENFDIGTRRSKLRALLEEVVVLESNKVVRNIYSAKINELLTTLQMLQATRDRDDVAFSRAADFVYGTPEVGDIHYVVASVQELIAEKIDNEDECTRAAAARLHRLFSPLDVEPDGGVVRSILPQGESIEGGVESLSEVVAAFEAALVELGVDGWVVVVDTDKGLNKFSVSQEHKMVRVPAEDIIKERKDTKKKLKGLIKHEIDTHVARRHNGEQSPLQLLGLGLDRYLKAEEGISTYAEQQVTGAQEFAGIPRYLSIALAKGLCGKPLDFRQTYEIMKDYNLIALPRDEQEVTVEWAYKTAYDDCLRIFRGTTGTSPGVVYPKDMAYFANRKIWTLVAKNPAVV